MSFSKTVFILHSLLGEGISEACCHVLTHVLNLTSHLSSKTKRLLHSVPLQSSKKAPLVGFPVRNSDGIRSLLLVRHAGLQ